MICGRSIVGFLALAGAVVLGACGSMTNRTAIGPTSAPAPPSLQYVGLLQARIGLTRESIAEISDSAEEAARRVFAGGRVYVDGSQPDFAAELLNRAGGLATLERVPARVERADVILYGARSRLTDNDMARISSWRSAGLQVVAFASRDLSANPYFKPSLIVDSGPTEGLALRDGTLCPSDSTLNLANAWVWTGEFFAACSRRGSVPVMNQSFTTNGGYARAVRYRNRSFHDDLRIAPIPPGVLGMSYLDAVGDYLARLEASSDRLALAGRWVTEATPRRCALEVFANTFPSQMTDDRTPRVFGAMSGDGATWPPRSARVVVAIEYVAAKQLLIDASHDRRTRLVYSSVVRAQDDRSRNIIYIDPGYPPADACVEVRGYDVPILPASAVMQSAIYWSIVAEAVGTTPQRSE